MVAGMFITSGLKPYGLYHVAKEGYEKAEEKTKDTELTKGERAGYTLSPVIQSTVDLIQGDSFTTVAKKNVKTHTDNLKAVKKVGKDCIDGPVPKWALAFTGGIGFVINALAD